MADFNAEVDDLAVFFVDPREEESVELMARWVSYATYTDPKYAIDPAAVAEYWSKSLLTREVAEASPYYVLNLQLMLKGDSVPKGADPEPTGKVQPALGDLVIIPQPRPGDKNLAPAYCVPFEDLEACPSLSGPQTADLRFMAVDEGVVVANIPKQDLVGMSCILVGLVNVRRAGALPKRVQFERLVQRY